MPLINCARCDKIFGSEKGETVCPECMASEKIDLKKVTEYLREHPLAGILEVHQKTGVSQAQIFRFIKSGSLKIRKPSEMPKCRICGAEIRKGIVCEKCESRIKGIKKNN